VGGGAVVFTQKPNSNGRQAKQSVASSGFTYRARGSPLFSFECL
jgi:hypothetical protein